MATRELELHKQWIEQKIEIQNYAGQRLIEINDMERKGITVDENEIADLVYDLTGYDVRKHHVINGTRKLREGSKQVTKALKKPYPKPSTYFIGNKFKPVSLAQDITEKYLWVFSNGHTLYWYDHGVYKSGGESEFMRIAQILLGEEWRQHYVKEALEWTKQAEIPPDKRTINANDGLLNLQNGLLNWKTGELLDHTPDRLSTIQLPVVYDPNAGDPSVMEFINSVIPDDAINTVFEMIGYCLIPTTKYEKAIMLYGNGANGKSTLINLLTALVGQNNMSNISLQDLETNRFKVAQIQDKLVNAFADLPRKGLVNANNFKAIVSGDVLNAEHKYGNPFEFKPFAKLVFSTNELPWSADVSDGYYRRWLIIPFTKKFTGENRDANLVEKLTTPAALSTLLNYAIDGLRRLETQGFTESATARNVLKQYRKENDNVAYFIEECCELGEEYKCLTTTMYEAYKKWCEASGLKALGKPNFSKRLKVLQPDLDNSHRRKGDTCQHWTGITLK